MSLYSYIIDTFKKDAFQVLMMKMYELDTRKLIEIRGSLMATLPISWVRHNSLMKGQRVRVKLDNIGRLVIIPTATERSNIEPAPGADIGVTTPGTDGHQTQGADACVNID
jgi:hypothetical protein